MWQDQHAQRFLESRCSSPIPHLRRDENNDLLAPRVRISTEIQHLSLMDDYRKNVYKMNVG